MSIQVHPDGEVMKAIIRLTDALCSWERNTGRENVLIIREVEGFVYRAVNGKPGVPEYLTDAQLVADIIK